MRELNARTVLILISLGVSGSAWAGGGGGSVRGNDGRCPSSKPISSMKRHSQEPPTLDPRLLDIDWTIEIQSLLDPVTPPCPRPSGTPTSGPTRNSP